MANGYLGDQRIRPMEIMMHKMCSKKGYDLDTAFKGLLDYLLWMFDPEGRKPDGWRFDNEDAMMFLDMAKTYFQMMDEQLKQVEWYDAFGDLYMALHPGGGGKAQFFTPSSVCQVTAEVCMRDARITEQQGRKTPFGHRTCINDPAAGSSRLLLAGAAVFKKLQKDEMGYDDILCATHRPYLVAEDLDYNCVKMSAINMMMHGHFGECVCHDSLCEPDAVRLGYIVNESMWPFPTNIPSIRRYDDPRRFVVTSYWIQRKKESEAQPDRQNASAVLPLGGGEHSQPKEQAQQLTLW